MKTDKPASSVCLPENARNALATFRKAMRPIRSVDTIDFHKFVKIKEFVHGEVLVGSVDFMLADLPCIIRRIQVDEISKQNSLASVDMKSMSKLCAGALQHYASC